ncbi:MAG: flagellar type III secretion system pore protein FliP [Lachnospiraceae bacterium]|nr:flagellar type III secretion system pore protein FliP [Lachnospiraceae bacterium]
MFAVLLCGMFLCTTVQALAASVDTALTSSSDAGEEEDRTYIREPGSSEDADELGELNIANNLTVAYNNGNGSVAGALRVMLILTGIALAPILIICLTSFTRILIVLHFTRAALNTQTAPPNQVLLALSLFLTFFIMQPVITEINETALKPFEAGEITQEEALEIGIKPLRTFMAGQTMTKDAKVFCEIGGYEWTGEWEDVPTSALIPSFMVSELRTAFIIGFVIYIPFIVIDMVVASALMSMGMMMLPPTTISMPFKILLFVLADGWNLIIVELVRTFY